MPAAVLPNRVCRAFGHTREYPAIDNEYRNGESQRPAKATDGRRKWALTKRQAAVQLVALRNFYSARNGTHGLFEFYDPCETPALADKVTQVWRSTRLRFGSEFTAERLLKRIIETGKYLF